MNGLNFNKGFKVYVDGEHVPDVIAVQMTLDRTSTEMEHNKITLYSKWNGTERITTMTVELEAVNFVTTNV